MEYHSLSRIRIGRDKAGLNIMCCLCCSRQSVCFALLLVSQAAHCFFIMGTTNSKVSAEKRMSGQVLQERRQRLLEEHGAFWPTRRGFALVVFVVSKTFATRR
jgi:hypothetical protein